MEFLFIRYLGFVEHVKIVSLFLFFPVFLYVFNEIFSNLGNYIDGEFIWALFVCFSFEFPKSTFTLLCFEKVLPIM